MKTTETNSLFSTVIASNRQNNINKQTVNALTKNNSKLIFVKQGKLKKKQTTNQNCNELLLKKENVSLARNLGIKYILKKYSSSKFICFTDDDCIVDLNWLKNMHISYKKDKADLVFGKTIPYVPHSQPNLLCPATFEKKANSSDLIKTHWKYIGLGNNWSAKKEVFENIGTFKTWLGPGGIGQSGEEVEFIIRCSIAGLKISYNNKCVIEHDKWITHQEARLQAFAYTCGEVAAYSFYAFQGVKECWPIISTKLGYSRLQIKNDLKEIINTPQKTITNLMLITREIVALVKGFSIAFIYSQFISIPEKENVVKNFYHKND